MADFPIEILNKYDLPPLSEYVKTATDRPEVIEGYYKQFLINSNHVCDEILEGVATSSDYADELYYREFARQQINGDTGDFSAQKPLDARVDGIEIPTNIMLGTESNMEQASEQIRKALQMFAQTLTDEQAMEISTIYPAYEVGRAYSVDEMFTYGINDVGDPQLYRVVQAHTSQSDWTPDATPALYTPIGLNPQGYPKWSRPTGAHDAYNTGDIVDYNGTLYKSLIDGNVWSPEEYPAGWEEV